MCVSANPESACWTPLVDRDARRREDPTLIDTLCRDPHTRLLLVDARGRISCDTPAQAPDLPADGLMPVEKAGSPCSHAEHAVALAPLRVCDVKLTGLALLYLGQCAGESWLAVTIPDDAMPPSAPDTSDETATNPHTGTEDMTSRQKADTRRTPCAVAALTRQPTHTEQSTLTHILRRYPLSAARAVGAALSDRDAQLALSAVALAAWHAQSGYCATCGHPTTSTHAGWARRCTGCHTMTFPRMDPAVIMAVTDVQDRIVLVHGARWAPGRYSTIAGFVEAGETAEAAVVREVREETGLHVEHVEYVTSQPWPFPRSFMLAYRARLASEPGQPQPDGMEVDDVLCLSREDLAQAVAQGTVMLPGPASVARRLIDQWYAHPLIPSEADSSEARPDTGGTQES